MTPPEKGSNPVAPLPQAPGVMFDSVQTCASFI